MMEDIAVAVSVAMGLFVVFFLTPRLIFLYCQAGIRRKNYLGHRITPALGPAIVLSWIPAVICLPLCSGKFASSFSGFGQAVFPPIVLALGLMAIGFLDDIFDENIRGYRGHFSSLMEGRLTAGMLKALWGTALTVLVVFNDGLLARNMYTETVSPAAVLLLRAMAVLTVLFWANGLNFLDRRPGRALKVFLFLGLAISFWGLAARGVSTPVWGSRSLIHGGDISGPLTLMLPLLVIVLALLPVDLGGKAMLGDAGSNPLGALLGFYALLMLPPGGRLLFLFLGLMLNLIGERVSISGVIDGNRFLSFLDRLGCHAEK